MRYLLLILLVGCATTKRTCEISVVKQCERATYGEKVGSIYVTHNFCSMSVIEYNGSHVVDTKIVKDGLVPDSRSVDYYLGYKTSDTRTITFDCKENGR